ncbi:MAG: 6-phosphogluconolactonase [Candidimonas sp.]|nr:MAG: 6-phosphogluconolactonase [Candidimonas sp.]TAM25537.1 MAG: 6-phosphogluconolactonase [Candidimonas sp.]TAM76723.1 MAG: 6-phosphogluconolactonase [Candidimonas sp.]
MIWHPYEQSQPCIKALAHAVSALLQRAIAQSGAARLAVSGGHSPIPLFTELSQSDLDWPKIHITLVDERFVAPNDPDSNENLVRRYLLVGRASQARFQGLVTHVGDIEASVDQANRDAAPATLAILGMGEDGHTASLFPNAPELAQALDPSQTRDYISITPPAAPHRRISSTLASLLRAQHRILFISGSQKLQVFEQAAKQSTPDHPVSFLLTRVDAPINVYWHP